MSRRLTISEQHGNHIETTRQNNIGRYFLRGARLYAELAFEKLKAYDYPNITMVHLTVIRHIDVEGTRTTVVAERAGMTKQAVGQVVATLEQEGYVIRKADPSDGRAQLVQFTDKGWQFLLDAQDIKVSIESEFSEILGEDEFDQLHDMIIKLLSHYEQA